MEGGRGADIVCPSRAPCAHPPVSATLRAMASKKSPARAKKKSASSKAPKAAKAKSPKARKASVSLPPRVQSSATPLTSSELLADLPRLTDAERAAFRAQFTDEQCAALGDRTKSGAVQKDAFGWAKVMHSTLRAHPHAVRRYGATRLAWFVECLRGLETALKPERGRVAAIGAYAVPATL